MYIEFRVNDQTMGACPQQFAWGRPSLQIRLALAMKLIEKSARKSTYPKFEPFRVSCALAQEFFLYL